MTGRRRARASRTLARGRATRSLSSGRSSSAAHRRAPITNGSLFLPGPRICRTGRTSVTGRPAAARRATPSAGSIIGEKRSGSSCWQRCHPRPARSPRTSPAPAARTLHLRAKNRNRNSRLQARRSRRHGRWRPAPGLGVAPDPVRPRRRRASASHRATHGTRTQVCERPNSDRPMKPRTISRLPPSSSRMMQR